MFRGLKIFFYKIGRRLKLLHVNNILSSNVETVCKIVFAYKSIQLIIYSVIALLLC